MNAFLLVFNDNTFPFVNRQIITNFLDTRRGDVPNWYACFSHGILINSERSAFELGVLIRNQFPQIFFVITQVNPYTIDGWAPKTFWDFVNNPRAAGT
jgi:hypothetical protein